MTINKLPTTKLFKLFILLSVITSFFIGFFFRDLSPGGAQGDFNARTWFLLQSFKDDFYFTIQNYGKFGDAAYPFFYIFNAYINPFSANKVQFLISNTFISFFVFIIFALLLKKNFPKIHLIDCYLSSSVILLLPFFRSTAYWGTTENLGWLLLLLSLFFFTKIRLNREVKKINYFDVFVFCFLSSCALYTRPSLIFLPISYMLYLFLINKNFRVILASILFYSILSIPAFILFFLWGGFFDMKNIDPEIIVAHSYVFIIKNIPIILSYFAFYFLPILFIETKEIGIKNFSLKYIKPFILSFFVLIFLWKLNYLNYLIDLKYGGGAILKLNFILLEKNLFLMLISSALGFSLIYTFLKENFKYNICTIFPIFLIYGFPQYLFQEYLEPLIIFIFFSGMLKIYLKDVFNKNIGITNLTTITYFSLYLVAATYYDLMR